MAFLDKAARGELKAKLESLRRLPFAELAALPEQSVEYKNIDGHSLRLTVMPRRNREGFIEIIVRADRRFLGFLRKGFTAGFSMSLDGRTEMTSISKGLGA